MEIEWMPEALENYIKTLEYWDRHNASPIYSDMNLIFTEEAF